MTTPPPTPTSAAEPLWTDSDIHGRIANHVEGELLHHGTSTEMLTRSDVREMMFEMRDEYQARIDELAIAQAEWKRQTAELQSQLDAARAGSEGTGQDGS